VLRALWVLLVAAAVAGCGDGRAAEPPRPDRTITAEGTGVADHWTFGSCSHVVVTLRSGEVFDVARTSSKDPACPGEQPTRFLLGDDLELTAGADENKPWAAGSSTPHADAGTGPLVLWGTNDDQAWLGAIRSPPTGTAEPCWNYRFDDGEGAYKDSGSDGQPVLHLSSGLLLPIASDFQLTYPPDPFPLRSADAICVDLDGEVVAANVWVGGY